MDIRTRLIFALVAISLVSMAAVGAFAYGAVQDLLLENQLRKLEAVAANKENDLQRLLVAWRDRVNLVTSRTQLRILLAAIEDDGNDDDYRERLQRILDDALAAVDSLRGIELYSRKGQPVARTGVVPPGGRPRPEDLAALAGVKVHQDAEQAPDGELQISFIAPMNLVDRRIGSARVVLSAQELEDVTAETTGLGDSGETVIVRADAVGRPVALSGRRHEARGGDVSRGAPEPEREAVGGREGVFTDAVDYRGERVYAATRWITDPGWGLVVKVDVAEEVAEILALRDTLSKLALSLSAFGIVAGMVLGLVFSRPVRELAEVAERIREGEWDLRADESSEDEVGQLGMHFNRMTEELVAANRALEARLQKNGKTEPPC